MMDTLVFNYKRPETFLGFCLSNIDPFQSILCCICNALILCVSMLIIYGLFNMLGELLEEGSFNEIKEELEVIEERKETDNSSNQSSIYFTPYSTPVVTPTASTQSLDSIVPEIEGHINRSLDKYQSELAVQQKLLMEKLHNGYTADKNQYLAPEHQTDSEEDLGNYIKLSTTFFESIFPPEPADVISRLLSNRPTRLEPSVIVGSNRIAEHVRTDVDEWVSSTLEQVRATNPSSSSSSTEGSAITTSSGSGVIVTCPIGVSDANSDSAIETGNYTSSIVAIETSQLSSKDECTANSMGEHSLESPELRYNIKDSADNSSTEDLINYSFRFLESRLSSASSVHQDSIHTINQPNDDEMPAIHSPSIHTISQSTADTDEVAATHSPSILHIINEPTADPEDLSAIHSPSIHSQSSKTDDEPVHEHIQRKITNTMDLLGANINGLLNQLQLPVISSTPVLIDQGDSPSTSLISNVSNNQFSQGDMKQSIESAMDQFGKQIDELLNQIDIEIPHISEYHPVYGQDSHELGSQTIERGAGPSNLKQNSFIIIRSHKNKRAKIAEESNFDYEEEASEYFSPSVEPVVDNRTDILPSESSDDFRLVDKMSHNRFRRIRNFFSSLSCIKS